MALTIGKLAKRAGVNVETIRFYERKGLIQQPSRNGPGYRQYPQEILKRLQFIRTSKLLGLTLREISGLLNLLDNRMLDCNDAEKLLNKKLDEIEAQICALKKMKQQLIQIKRACSEERDSDVCLIEEFYTAPTTAAEKLAL